ncbi:hypothetical protein KAR48_02180 [bacterium]|nr:hypothetical protein [bacterium]
MQITPLAAESLGARSMATFIETMDTRILIDPGIWLMEKRFDLRPLAVEHWTVEKMSRRVQLFLESARAIVLTHFHPSQIEALPPESLADKTLFIKNPNQYTSPDRRNKVFAWMSEVRKVAKDLEFVDNKVFRLGSTRIEFSKPVAENPDIYNRVLQVSVQEADSCFVFSSEIAGACHGNILDFICRQNPDMLYLDGPVTYRQQGEIYNLDEKVSALKAVIESTSLQKMILDHHICRDFQWRHKIEPLFKVAQDRGVIIQTAAEFRGEPLQLLESRRKQLHEETGLAHLPYE